MPSLSVEHFPLEGNSDFSRVGTRTCYTLQNEKFTVFKDTVIWVDGQPKEIEKGEEILLVKPPKLFSCLDVGLSRGTFAVVESDHGRGFIQITHITKPKASLQPRVASGIKSQEVVAGHIESMACNLKLESMAGASMTAPDLVFTGCDGQVQVEVKGVKEFGRDIVLFDKSVKRAKPKEEVDKAVDIVIEGNDLPVDPGTGSLGRAVDYSRGCGTRAALVEDGLAGRGGSLPREHFITWDESAREAGRDYVADQLASKGDNYLAVVSRSSEEVRLFHSGLGSNPLDAPPLCVPRYFGVTPYGGGYNGSTRVGVVIGF